MANIDKNGYEACDICGTKYHISDPKTYELPNGKLLCKGCWIFISDNTSWGAEKRIKYTFEYRKVSTPHSLKWAVWKRDNFTCKECGAQDNLAVDHIKPESIGGEMSMENLQTLCKPCNSKKSYKYGDS
jgi:hypothetical protein